MKYHNQLLKDIDAAYEPRRVRGSPNKRPLNYYEILCAKHKVLIDSIKDELYPVSEQLPSIGSYVLAVQDLSPLGKGIFLCDYWYNKYGFVGQLDQDDAYRFITHWTYMRLEND